MLLKAKFSKMYSKEVLKVLIGALQEKLQDQINLGNVAKLSNLKKIPCPSVSFQDRGTRTRFTFPPQTSRKLDKFHETTIFRHWTGAAQRIKQDEPHYHAGLYLAAISTP